MFQPGNGPFTLRQGGILVGEACPPGFVIHSQDTFLQLYDRIKKVIARKGEVVVEVKEEMGEFWTYLKSPIVSNCEFFPTG